MERLVSEVRAEQLFGKQGVRPFDPQLAERLASMNVGDAFVIDPIDGMTPRSIKTFYNRTAREVGVHLRWRKGDKPIAAQVVTEPTYDELRADQRRLNGTWRSDVQARRNGFGPTVAELETRA